MLVFKIIGIALTACLLVVVVKQTKPELAIVLSIVAGIIILSLCFERLSQIVGVFENLVNKTSLDGEILKIILKIVGVGYIIEFSANICSDAGSSVLADKLLFAGKIMIMSLSMPVLLSIVDIVAEILP